MLMLIFTCQNASVAGPIGSLNINEAKVSGNVTHNN